MESKKPLSAMSLEELWQLFPISLVAHNEKWANEYAQMEVFLNEIFTDVPIVRISHIGSTAIKDIAAKDIVDILVETDDIEMAASKAEMNGFIRMSSGSGRISLNKGYTPEGFADEVFHLHIRQVGDNDELYFRDYLNDHPEIAREYERLKQELAIMYEHNRDAYTDGKTAFVRHWTAEARKLYGQRYERKHHNPAGRA